MPRFLLIAVAALGLLLPAKGRAEPHVLASIAPLHGVAAAVMEGVGTPQLLLDASTSAHGYALKPSDRKKLESADIILYVSPGYETFLVKPLSTLSSHPRVVQMDQLDGIQLLKNRDESLKATTHEHGPYDPHLWLDVPNTISLTREVAQVLARLDPPHEALYWKNAQNYAARLEALDTQLAAALRPVSGLKYIVFHDGFQYFENHYGLTPAGIISVDPEVPASAKHLAELRQRIRQEKISCIFKEPQFSSRNIEALAEEEHIKVIPIDYLGSAFPPGKDRYPRMMEALKDSYLSCK